MSSPPVAYTRQAAFLNYQTAHPNDPPLGSDLDAECDAIKTTLNRTVSRLGEIQRSDGLLANQSVHADALSSTVRTLIVGLGTIKGAWATATAYIVKDTITYGGYSYLAVSAHTSGTFATDLAAGKWLALAPIQRVPMFVDIDDYRLAADPANDDGPALVRAATAAGGIGACVKIPAAITIKSQAVLPDNTVLEGGGFGSVITGDIAQFLLGSGLAYVALRNLTLTVTHNSYWPKFTNCTQLVLEGVQTKAYVDGTTGLAAFGVYIAGCARVWVDRCYFLNANDGVYLTDTVGDGSGTKCGSAIVSRSFFEHTLHGNFFSYPVGVYQVNCDHLIVDKCIFKNIFPGNLGNPSPIGYAVYEGDGACKSTQVKNCRYTTTENRTDTVFASTSTSADVIVSGNDAVAEHATGGGYFYRGSAVSKALHIENNIGRGFAILAAESGASDSIKIVNNDIVGILAQFSAIQVGVAGNGATVASVDIRGNRISNSTYGGIFVNAGTWYNVSDNDLLDCNTSNTARAGGSEKKSSCIVVSGVSGQISKNRMRNTASGHAKYGVDLVDAVNTTRIEPDNTFSGMETGSVNNHVYLVGSGTVDPGNLVDGAGQTVTLTVSGAALGDFAEASFSLDLQGITLSAYVSSADTVSVRFQNESGGALDLASGTLRARVLKRM